MKYSFLAIIASVLAAAGATHGFVATGRNIRSAIASSSAIRAYVPDGLTSAEYSKIKAQEKQRTAGKNLGALGPKGFKSRSMQAWQEAYEKGFAKHEVAPFGYRQALKEGKIRKQDVPYMVRGGSWDNSDVRGAKKRQWLRTDKAYAAGGYKKEQSASLLGSGPGFDWAGTRSRDVNMGNRVIPGLS